MEGTAGWNGQVRAESSTEDERHARRRRQCGTRQRGCSRPRAKRRNSYAWPSGTRACEAEQLLSAAQHRAKALQASAGKITMDEREHAEQEMPRLSALHDEVWADLTRISEVGAQQA